MRRVVLGTLVGFLCSLLTAQEVPAQPVWEIAISRNDHQAYDLECNGEGVCLATMREGINLTSYVLRSDDQGVSWSRVHEDRRGDPRRFPVVYHSIVFISDDEVMITGDSAVYLHSMDAGLTWKELIVDSSGVGDGGDISYGPLEAQTEGYGILSLRPDIFGRGLERDILYRLKPGDKAWHILKNQPRETARTTETRITFVAAPGVGVYLVGLTEPTSFFDSATSTVVRDSTMTFAHSSDTGNTWTYHEFSYPGVAFIRSPAITFLNDTDAVITGLIQIGYGKMIVARTRDAGRTWNIIRIGSNTQGAIGITDSQFESFDKGFAARGGTVERTTDGGMTWDTDSVPWLPDIGPQWVEKVHMFDDSSGVAMTDAGALYYLKPDPSSVARDPQPTHTPSIVWNRADGAVPLGRFWDMSSTRGMRVNVYDVRGSLISKSHTAMLDTENAGTGLYIVEVSRPGGLLVRIRLLLY